MCDREGKPRTVWVLTPGLQEAPPDAPDSVPRGDRVVRVGPRRATGHEPRARAAAVALANGAAAERARRAHSGLGGTGLVAAARAAHLGDVGAGRMERGAVAGQLDGPRAAGGPVAAACVRGLPPRGGGCHRLLAPAPAGLPDTALLCGSGDGVT